MISFDIHILNPWAKDNFKNLFQCGGRLSRTKACEFQIYKSDTVLFRFSFVFGWRGYDHAGLRLEISVLTYTAEFGVYDRRHWDYNKNCWEK